MSGGELLFADRAGNWWGSAGPRQIFSVRNSAIKFYGSAEGLTPPRLSPSETLPETLKDNFIEVIFSFYGETEKDKQMNDELHISLGSDNSGIAQFRCFHKDNPGVFREIAITSSSLEERKAQISELTTILLEAMLQVAICEANPPVARSARPRDSRLGEHHRRRPTG